MSEIRRLQRLGASPIRPATPLSRLGAAPKPVTGYCVKCRAKRDMVNPRLIRMKNRRLASQGTCPVCNTKMFKIRKG